MSRIAASAMAVAITCFAYVPAYTADLSPEPVSNGPVVSAVPVYSWTGILAAHPQ